MTEPGWPFRTRLTRVLVLGVCASMAVIASVAYRAVVEWERASMSLAERRAATSVDLLVTALTRDMRAVQTSVLADERPDDLTVDSNQADQIASALATYPYPEAFFTWRNGHAFESSSFYSRYGRSPTWMPKPEASTPFQVVEGTSPVLGRRLLTRIGRDAALGRRYSTFDMEVGGSRYQVVARLFYEDAFRDRLKAVFGFVTDMAWIRQHYFRDVARQIGEIGKTETSMSLAIVDGEKRTVVGSTEAAGTRAVGIQSFPLLFFDPRLVAIDWPEDLHRESWTAQAIVSGDSAVQAANLGARRTLAIVLVTAVVLLVALVAIARATQAAADLANIRAEFVSTVTHELKTPITTMQTIGETFAAGRGMTAELSRRYGRMAVDEAKRLRRLIDNLLAYSRITDTTEVYTFEAVALYELVEHTLLEFASLLEYHQFEVFMNVPSDLPNIRADRGTVSLALANLVDNAIRYSTERKSLDITAHAESGMVVVDVSDKGVGIAPQEIPLVTQRFRRGQGAVVGGSGLGLAIVDRIMADHGGTLKVHSVVGSGTTIQLGLPIWRSSDEPTHSDHRG